MARTKKPLKLKQPVTLREAKLKSGNVSLYLDIYHRGERRYEFLKLYLIPEIDQSSKMQNRQTREIAEKIRAERILQLQSFGIENMDKAKRSQILLSTWLDLYVKEDTDITPSTRHGRNMTRMRVNKFLEDTNRQTITLGEVNKEFCLEFIKHLKSAAHLSYNAKKHDAPTITDTTINHYQTVLSGALTKAVKDGIIKQNPFKLFSMKERVQARNKEIEYLTKDELQKLIDTDCGNPSVRIAFLFSCFTGLRKSDIKLLTYRNIRKTPDGKSEQITIRMKKTDRPVIVPISEEAKKWLPLMKDPDSPIFNLPDSDVTLSRHLERWVKNAGIDKHITFHCARHTFGTMLLTLGVDIYTVSKLLGHTSVATTQIYAKIVDSKKIDAIARLDNIFN